MADQSADEDDHDAQMALEMLVVGAFFLSGDTAVIPDGTMDGIESVPIQITGRLTREQFAERLTRAAIDPERFFRYVPADAVFYAFEPRREHIKVTVSCPVHGPQQGIVRCRHVEEGAPIRDFDQPADNKFGLALCRECACFAVDDVSRMLREESLTPVCWKHFQVGRYTFEM